MTAANAHTPTYEVYYDDSVIELPTRRLICHPHRLDDAERIVAALNSHAALLAALQAVVKYEISHMVWCGAQHDNATRPCVCGLTDLEQTIRAALAQANNNHEPKKE